MSIKRKNARYRQELITQQPERRWWKEILNKVTIAVIGATGGVFLLTYSDALNSVIKTTLAPGWAWTQDILSPMPEDKLIGVELRFYIPPHVNKERSFEGVSATLWPERCKRSEGASIMRTFDGGERDTYTNAIVSISCRASGRTLVTLTPQSGTTLTVYDGIFKDGEKVAFPGVPGSHYAGQLTLHLLDTKAPEGPLVPVNKCQITNTCLEELGGSFQIQEHHQ